MTRLWGAGGRDADCTPKPAIQRWAELHWSDRQRATRYLSLGGASPELVKEVSESLAGRVAYHDLGPLAVDETGVSEWRKLWLRGGFPRSHLSEDETTSALWRGSARTWAPIMPCAAGHTARSPA